MSVTTTLAKRAGSGQCEALLTRSDQRPDDCFRPQRDLALPQGRSTGASSAPSTSDAALDRVRHARSDDEYRAAVAGLQQNFMDDPPAIFLAWSVRARARQPAVRRAGGRAWPRRAEHDPPLETGYRRPAREPKSNVDGVQVRHIATRFALLLGVAAVVPAARLRRRLHLVTPARHPRLDRRRQPATSPTRAAEEIRRYVVHQRRAAESARPRICRTPGSISASRIRFSRTTSSSSASSARSRCSTKPARWSRRAASASRACRSPRSSGSPIDGVVDVADPRRRGSAADVSVRHPSRRA